MINPFKFTNKWQYANRMDKDRVDLGFYADWSDRDISGRFRISSLVVLAFGLTWSMKEYQAYVCLFNFQIGFVKERQPVTVVK